MQSLVVLIDYSKDSINEKFCLQLTSGRSPKVYSTGRLAHSGRQNDEKMSHKIRNAQSRAKFFRHSSVLSLPAVLLCKLPKSSHEPAMIPTERMSKCAEACICKFIDGYSYEEMG